MLEVDIEDRFGDFALDAHFTAENAGITALFGRSGAGKTSIIRALAGLRRPAAGRIALNGDTLFDGSRGIHLPPERRRLGYVFQEGRLFPHLTVEGNLRYGLRRTAARDRRIDFDDIVALMDLGALLRRRPLNLSGGETQRVAIGRALLTSPRLLLMDEPLASLDAARKQEILAFVERLRDELAIPIVYVSHAMEEIVRLADRLVLVSDGAVKAAGALEDVMNRLELRPLTGRFDAGAVITTRVTGFDSRYGLTRLGFAGGEFLVAARGFAAGTRVRLRVRARDVSLARTRPADISVLNVFAGTVTDIGAEIDTVDAPQIDIGLDIGVPLWARITRKSLHELGVEPGARLYALVKSVAIDRGSLGYRGAERD